MKIVIVGYGWLGQQLAAALCADGHQLVVTRRNAQALVNLPAGVNGQVLDLNQPDRCSENLAEIFSNAVVICAIAPGPQLGTNSYINSLAQLNNIMTKAGSKALIHFSSTGIYQGLDGNVDENSHLLEAMPRVQLLVDGEKALQQFPQCITLRLAGLMGPGRHPGRFVANKTLPDPNGLINMVHAFDIIGAVQSILLAEQWQSAIYNLSCPAKVSRQDFYQRATDLASTQVQFVPETLSQRYVNPQKFITQYNFQYRFISACDALAYCF